MRSLISSLVFLIIALSLQLTPTFTGKAQAFQQTMTCNPEGIYRCKEGERPIPVQWPFLELTYHINSVGSKAVPNPADGTFNPDLERAIHQSFQTWGEPECSNLSFTFGGFTDETNIGYYDGPDARRSVNMVIWQDETWPYGTFSAVALTTVTFRPSTGIIVDADIEMNGALYSFSNTDNPTGSDVDIRNTLTHEVGHFLGLDHSMHPNATMFPTAPPLELTKRELHQDDIDGLCHIYPLNFVSEPLKPSPNKPTKQSCATTSITATSPLPLLAASLLLLATRLRKSRTTRTTP